MKQEFTIGLAGKRIRVGCFYDSTQVRCKEYLTDGKEDLKIIISREEVRAYLTERETAMALIDSASPLLDRTPA